ncbi:MAG: PAS domain S-box protein [Gallionellaceae bacterium]|jgi:PAS domain S-box-containing protein
MNAQELNNISLPDSSPVLQAILDALPNIYYLVDMQGRFVRWNQRSINVTGYSDAEHQNMNVIELFRGADCELVANRMREVFEKGEASVEAELATKDGRVIPYLFTGTRITIDGHPYLNGLGTDISERQTVEHQFADLLNFNQTILEKSPAGICVYSATGTCVMANEAYAKAVGGALEEVMKQNFRSNESWQRNGLLDLAELAFETGQSIRRDIEWTTSFGKRVVLECAFVPLTVADKSHLLVIVNDVSARVMAEHALTESMRQLERKEQAKTRFLAAAGHDLRQPVTAASLFVYALKLTSPTQHQSELIEQLSNSMTTFSDLLERLLDISKFDAGLIKPQFTSFNMAEMFNWLEQNFAQVALDKQLRFRFYFPLSKPLAVRTDIGLLKSVLMNLVANAIKYTSRGGILVAARIHGGKVLLQVWDTGIGIGAENLPHVFDEFYQIANPQRSREGGLGLGLSICRRASSLLGSEVACRSRLGRGSVFELSLPLDNEYQASGLLPANSAPSEAQNELMVSGRSIVVVEDDDLVAAGLVCLLREMGAVVRHFNNAEEALRQEDIARVDYFIVDYALGGALNGFQFLNAIQQRQNKPIRAVVITGETASSFIKNISDSSWPVLHKPINFAKLALCLSLFADTEGSIPATSEPTRGLQ